ncbi:hypothetical protein [Burkholderia pyrrocinia]|uniref:hypothetical protein n=1 Tax=Burkholderia pyrrocinia TaxID=60550 RepID=UPI00158EE416|nr:hypothetical protein [Burkholderia pyrrocinia]
MEGGEQGNYWPGFVDALSNMVMAMIFMVLVFMIVLLHYKLHQGPSTYPAPATAPSAASAMAKAAQTGNQGEKADRLQAEVERLTRELQQAKMQQSASGSIRPIQTGGTNNVASVVDHPEAIASKSEFVSSNKDAGRNPPTVSGDGTVWTVTYEGRAYELDQSAKDRLQGLLASLAPRKDALRIRILAEASEGVGYSDDRRIAYYRAIGVRNALLQAGWANSGIDIAIVNRTGQRGEPRVLLQPMPAGAAQPGGQGQ